MTVRPILSIGDPGLRVRAGEVARRDISLPAIQDLIDDLIDTMRHANGSGIAATQVGEPVRIMVMEVDDNPRYPYKPPIPLTVAINPEFDVLDDRTVTINEGCLSVPLRGELERRVNLGVRYTDRHGTDHERVLVVDRIDPKTLSTWEEFDRHHRDPFVERISRFVAEVGS